MNIHRHPYCTFQVWSNKVGRQTGGHRSGEAPVDDLSEEDADDDGELVEADETSAMGRGTDLSDVERRDIGAEADGGAAEDAPEDEDGKGPCPTGEH